MMTRAVTLSGFMRRYPQFVVNFDPSSRNVLFNFYGTRIAINRLIVGHDSDQVEYHTKIGTADIPMARIFYNQTDLVEFLFQNAVS